MNKVFLIGNLTRDPELRTTTGTGTSVCSFSIAISRRGPAGADGKREADFIPIVVWRELAESCAKFLQKGSQVAVSGSIQTRNYEGKDGKRVFVTEVIAQEVKFLSRIKGSEENRPHQPADPYAHLPKSVPTTYDDGLDLGDDDLPF